MEQAVKFLKIVTFLNHFSNLTNQNLPAMIVMIVNDTMKYWSDEILEG